MKHYCLSFYSVVVHLIRCLRMKKIKDDGGDNLKNDFKGLPPTKIKNEEGYLTETRS